MLCSSVRTSACKDGISSRDSDGCGRDISAEADRRIDLASNRRALISLSENAFSAEPMDNRHYP
jgi:hypothetical protein